LITTPRRLANNHLVLEGIELDVTDRKQATEEREELISELSNALSNVKTLQGLLPICSSCKKIRNDKGYWEQMEMYISEHSETDDAVLTLAIADAVLNSIDYAESLKSFGRRYPNAG